LLYSGVPAMTTWLATHFALIGGLAPHWVILIGVIIFFLMAIGMGRIIDLIATYRQSRKELNASESQPESSNKLMNKLIRNAARDARAARIAAAPCGAT